MSCTIHVAICSRCHKPVPNILRFLHVGRSKLINPNPQKRVPRGLSTAGWILIRCALIAAMVAFTQPGAVLTGVKAAQQVRRVNAPYWAPGAPYPSHSIFWFGEVSRSSNYADVRLIYYDTALEVVVHVIDRLLQYDTSPSPADLTQWDAVTLYLDLDGNTGSVPDQQSYRLEAQLNWWEPRQDYQASYRGNGSTWSANMMSFTTTTGWRGGGLNDNEDDKGWNAVFTIPFSSLGLAGAPPPGTIWGLGVAFHDRDDPSAAPLADHIWVEQLNPNNPGTWGQLHFGVPAYTSPQALPEGTTVVRQGLNGAEVVDGHVGGHTTCADGLDHWTEWGEANYAGYDQINIQNQWDVSDYPCFSKFYVSFPLTAVPAGKIIVSATLTMHLFGNSGGDIWGEPPDSYIQVLSVGEDWSEATLNWNNGPLALENISGTWVEPMPEELVWPGIPYSWDVSRAAAAAYSSDQKLRLALYSADGERHTGKYMTASDVGDWDAVGRPTLTVVWGDLCSQVGANCSFAYLPMVLMR